MTKDEISRIKTHIEIHARRERGAVIITQILRKAVDELEQIAELEKENAELKAVERMALYSRMSDRLAKAEELLLELYYCIPSSMADSCKETLQKVALFFKDSEVEK